MFKYFTTSFSISLLGGDEGGIALASEYSK